MKYIKGKGILVGIYNEEDIELKKDKSDVERVKKETGYQYTNIEYVKKRGCIIGLKIYVCSGEDCLSNLF